MISKLKIGVIISYHPPIFRSIKRLTLENEKQKDVLLCVANGYIFIRYRYEFLLKA